MKKFKKIIAMGCAAVMALSIMSIGAFAAETKYPPVPEEGIHGNVGDIFESDGFLFEIVDPNSMPGADGIMPCISDTPWGWQGIFINSGTTYPNEFEMTSVLNFWKVWYSNNQAAGYKTTVTVEGNGIYVSKPIWGGTAVSVYKEDRTSSPVGWYDVTVSSPHEILNGQLNLRRASTYAELEVY